MRKFRSLFSRFFPRNFARKFEPNFVTFCWNESDFPWTFVASATNCDILLARTRNFVRHLTIVQSPSRKLLPVIDTFNFSCNLHEMYHLLFETVPWVEAYTLQTVRINHWPDKTRSYTVKGDTWYLRRLFKTSSLALSWDTALPTLLNKTNTYHFR